MDFSFCCGLHSTSYWALLTPGIEGKCGADQPQFKPLYSVLFMSSGSGGSDPQNDVKALFFVYIPISIKSFEHVKMFMRKMKSREKSRIYKIKNRKSFF